MVLAQNDIRQLQLAKGAIYGGVMMLQRIIGVRDDQIEEVMLSGGFGNYVNIESAMRIGLLLGRHGNFWKWIVRYSR